MPRTHSIDVELRKFAVTLSVADDDFVRAQAQKLNVSRAEIVRRCIERERRLTTKSDFPF